MLLLSPHAKLRLRFPGAGEAALAGPGGRKPPPPSLPPSLPQPPPCPAAAPTAPGWPCPSFPSSQHQRLNKHDFSSFFFFFSSCFLCPRRRCVRGGQRALGPGGHRLVAFKALLNHDLLFPSSVPVSSNLPSVSLAAPMLKWPGFEVPLPVSK